MPRAISRIHWMLPVTLLGALVGCTHPRWNGPLTVGPIGRADLTCWSADMVQPIAAFRMGDDLTKPYVRILQTPAGINVLRDAPADHLHHHGLMFALAADGVNFWEEVEGTGRQIPWPRVVTVPASQRGKVIPLPGLQPDSPVAPSGQAGIGVQLAWVNPAGDPLLFEDRWIGLVSEAFKGDGSGPTVLLWHARLRTPPGTERVELGGKNYYGLGMRFAASMDKNGRFFNAAGDDHIQGMQTRPARWGAYQALADGQPVTAAMFDHPDNPRHPATWFTMDNPFAYLSATAALDQSPMTLLADKPVTFRWAVLLWDGHIEPAVIESAYSVWMNLRVSS